jgi:competence protein ComEA
MYMALDINNASAAELAEVEGVGPALAQRIIDYRDEIGGFASLDEVADIPGCDEELVMRLREAGVNLGAAAETEGSSDF